MIRLKVLVCMVLFCAGSSFAYVPFEGAQDQAISVAYYDQDPAFLSQLSPLSAGDPSWSAFTLKNGHWTGNINALSGIVHRAWGGAIYVGVPASAESARDLALSFLGSNADLLKVPISDLALISSRHAGHLWFVNFKQQYNGLDVFGALVSVRISDRGNVVLFQCDYRPGIDIVPAPALSAQSAGMAATSGLYNLVSEVSEPKLIIFPIPREDRFEYRLAYQTEVATEQPARWLTVVDAATGEVIYRKNLIYFDTVDGYIHGLIFPTTPFDTPVSMPFAYETVNITGLPAVHSDSDGFFTAEVSDTLPRRTTLAMTGSYVNVVNYQGAEASYIDTISPGDTLFVDWSAANSRNDERNTYYQVNVVHSFIKALDPGYTNLDFPLTANVNLNQTCNAYWDPGTNSVNFFMAGGGCSNTGEIADVIYHEYGHGITDFLYRPSAPSGAMHEGWSDYIAATITNQPLIGRGFYSNDPDRYLRSVRNHMYYPDSVTGEPHNDGLIISGALWDLREALGPRTGLCDSLWHFSRYGLSSNFQDYLFDMLEYDDDDDSLSNGTPHWDRITVAFGNHGIRVPDQIAIFHQPLDDTFDDSRPYTVIATVTYMITPPNTDSILVKYRTTNNGAFQSIQMTPTGNPDEYTASIPAQPLGTMVQYYISITDIRGRVLTDPATAPRPTFFFVVGQLALEYADSLEQATSWVRGAPGDDATTGLWERVDPVGTYGDTVPHIPYQPEDDHTPDPGVYCYVTGQQPSGNPDNGANDVDGGRTSITSPTYDLSAYENPVIEYWRWFTTTRGVDDTFMVQISSDNGSAWSPIEIVTAWENYWKRSRFLVDQVASDRSQIKLRFSASDDGAGSIVEAAFDDISFYSFNTTSIGDQEEGLPAKFALHENYPNPFNGKTEISFELARSSDVTLSIYDISGRLVYKNTMLNQTAGAHSIIWDSAQSGKELASGVYFYNLKTADFNASRKMLLLK
jgi:Zn-dependent metalloprotease